MSKVKEIRARLKAATPGPWEYDGSEIDAKVPGPEYYKTVVGKETRGQAYMEYDVLILSEVDGVFIAHAPDDITYLLEQLEGWMLAVWWAHTSYDPERDAVGHSFTADAEEIEAELCTCGAEHWHGRNCRLGPQEWHGKEGE